MRGPRWQVWRSGPLVATTELLVDKQLAAVGRLGRAAVVDIHDDALLQNDGLGSRRRRTLPTRSGRQRANREAFRVLVAPSGPFAELTGLDPDRTVVASNGSDTRTVRPRPGRTSPRSRSSRVPRRAAGSRS